MKPYCLDYFNRKPFLTREVLVGNIALGADNPIRVQSMTTADTMDTKASVEESIRMIDAGCEIVRLTAPSKKEAQTKIRHERGNFSVNRGLCRWVIYQWHRQPRLVDVEWCIWSRCISAGSAW